LEFRDGLGDSYGELFNGEGTTDAEQSNFNSEWGWYSTIDELSSGDITKFKEVISYNIHTCMKSLCYKISKAKNENNKIKKQLKSNAR
jgi:hypothetical protein